LTGFRRQTVAFTKAAALSDPPSEPIEIPYEGTTLPGWLFRPAGDHCEMSNRALDNQRAYDWLEDVFRA
jgi:hypothetical protein